MSEEGKDLTKLSSEIQVRMDEFKSEATRLAIQWQRTLLGLQKKGVKIIREMVPQYAEHYWTVNPLVENGRVKPNEYEVKVPVCVPMSIGWFDRVEGGHNVFLINQSTRWFMGPLPDFIAKEVNLPTPPPITVQDNTIHYDSSIQEEVGRKFGEHLSLIEENKATIKQGHHYDIIAEIIESGRLPFTPRPVLQQDLMESDFTTIKDDLTGKVTKLEIFTGMYSFEGDAYKTFLKYGCALIVWSMGTGKTVIGTYALSTIRGRKAVVVPTMTLRDQWKQFFVDNCPRLASEVEIYTYYGMSQQDWAKLCQEEFSLIVFDEAHFTPAPDFSKLATLRTKYRMGLSASPKREDGHESWIIALNGVPIGEDWRKLMQILGKTYHTVNVHIVKDFNAKFDLLQSLYNVERRTIIFVNRLDVGEKVARLLQVPFISGSTKDRLKVIKEAKSFVASRVLELGVSIKDLEHIIEIDFLFGSRREEIQRTGRLMHSKLKGRTHDIIFTKEELEQYGKRLHGLYERGFRYKLMPHLSDVAFTSPTPKKKPTVRRTAPVTDQPSLPPVSSTIKERLPGVDRTLERLSPVERAVAQTMLANPSRSYSSKELSLATGYSVGSIADYAHLGKLIQLGLVKREKDGKYQSAL